jgi:hypothetical protein
VVLPHSVDIAIIANKSFEARPLTETLTNQCAAPVALEPVESQNGAGGARLIGSISTKSFEVWCLEDLMPSTANKSSTEEKARALKTWNASVGLVIAFGTGASRRSNRNGDVVVGASTFAHDPYASLATRSQHESNWTHAGLDVVQTSSVAHLLGVDSDKVRQARRRLIRPPRGAASAPAIRVDSHAVALSVVNVTERNDYRWVDKQAIERFRKAGGQVRNIASSETTHGFLRLFFGAHFLYVTGITNQVGRFQQEVGRNVYAQNFAAAHNAAVALAWLLPEIAARDSL